MSKLRLIKDAVQAALVAGSPGVSVTYCRNFKGNREAQINFRIDGVGTTSKGAMQEHSARFEIESLVVGDDLGNAMLEEHSRLMILLAELEIPEADNVLAVAEDASFDDGFDGMHIGQLSVFASITFQTEYGSGS